FGSTIYNVSKEISASNRRSELAGSSSITPVTRNTVPFSYTIDRPITASLPKYFRAIARVSTMEFGTRRSPPEMPNPPPPPPATHLSQWPAQPHSPPPPSPAPPHPHASQNSRDKCRHDAEKKC